MKKKLEAELISIAHRILKLKNRSELDQLQQETLKLYEKISVLRFVEDNFADVKPTIGYASAEETLEELYGIEEEEPVHANEVEAKEEKSKDESPKSKEEEEPKAEEEAQATSQKPQAEEEQSEQSQSEEIQAEEQSEQPETRNPEPATEEQPVTEEDVKAMEASAEAVFENEDKSTVEEEEKAADAEVITIEPDKEAGTDEVKLDFGFAFDRTPAPEESVKQKEITFEDYADYKEPEFVKKGQEPQATSQEPQAEEKPQATSQEPRAEQQSEQPATGTETPVRDWRDWEPSTSPFADKKEEPQAGEEPQATSQQPQVQQQSEQPATVTQPNTQHPTPNTQHLKTISLGLNDRIAFEKNLFGGSGEDLNRVISQLNTIDTFDEAKDFVNDLVKPDYNNWQGKEEYEERLMELVEQRFS